MYLASQVFDYAELTGRRYRYQVLDDLPNWVWVFAYAHLMLGAAIFAYSYRRSHSLLMRCSDALANSLATVFLCFMGVIAALFSTGQTGRSFWGIAGGIGALAVAAFLDTLRKTKKAIEDAHDPP
jgi:hypothetical protein